MENAVLDCLASVFTDRAIAYRVHNNFDHLAIKGAVAVQLMVRSDLASAGVAFTLDPDTGFRDVVVITGSYGLGESVVGGVVDPDEVQVFKPMIDQEDPIIMRRIGRKQTSCVYTRGVSHKRTKTVSVSKADQRKPSFSDEEAKLLAKWCLKIEKHYSAIHGQDTPMDIEWVSLCLEYPLRLCLIYVSHRFAFRRKTARPDVSSLFKRDQRRFERDRTKGH